MDPNALNVQQLKHILKQYQLPLTGRKTELILKMQRADPSDTWMQEAARYLPSEDNLKGGDNEEEVTSTGEVSRDTSSRKTTV